jgi:hypothetical protein
MKYKIGNNENPNRCEMMNRCGALLLLLLALMPSVSAQNVAGYDVMEEPLLFLLREPAVHRDLGLSDMQEKRLVQVNESLDSILLGSRNKKNAKAVQQDTREVMEKSRAAVSKILSKQQQDRLRQIAYRLKGIPFVLLPDAAEKLGLTAGQKTTIQETVTETQEKVSKVQTREYQGAKAYQEAQRAVATARKREQEEILAALSDVQKRKIATLVGKNFDPSELGQATFRAPEIVDSGQWINSDPLTWSDLKGKVVALHFFAFG